MYHGWRYDGTGRCTEMPAEKNARSRRSHRRLPGRRLLRLLFAYLGGEPVSTFDLPRNTCSRTAPRHRQQKDPGLQLVPAGGKFARRGTCQFRPCLGQSRPVRLVCDQQHSRTVLFGNQLGRPADRHPLKGQCARQRLDLSQQQSRRRARVPEKNKNPGPISARGRCRSTISRRSATFMPSTPPIRRRLRSSEGEIRPRLRSGGACRRTVCGRHRGGPRAGTDQRPGLCGGPRPGRRLRPLAGEFVDLRRWPRLPAKDFLARGRCDPPGPSHQTMASADRRAAPRSAAGGPAIQAAE